MHFAAKIMTCYRKYTSNIVETVITIMEHFSTIHYGKDICVDACHKNMISQMVFTSKVNTKLTILTLRCIINLP